MNKIEVSSDKLPDATQWHAVLSLVVQYENEMTKLRKQRPKVIELIKKLDENESITKEVCKYLKQAYAIKSSDLRSDEK